MYIEFRMHGSPRKQLQQLTAKRKIVRLKALTDI